MTLSTTDHDRDNAGLTYVYPVVSRRSRGVSVGINLNPNQACNWRCVYCQVPNLKRGAGPNIRMSVLKDELFGLLDDIVHGDFLTRCVPEESRTLRDLAFSGDGESTSSPQFLDALKVVQEALVSFDLMGRIKVVLISNGSLVQKQEVQEGLALLRDMGGEMWFKLDGGSDRSLSQVNGFKGSLAAHLNNLRLAAGQIPCWIQTCVFARDGRPPADQDIADYLDTLKGLVEEGIPLEGVLLYGMARPAMLPESSNLSRLDPQWLEALGGQISDLGLTVNVNP